MSIPFYGLELTRITTEGEFLWLLYFVHTLRLLGSRHLEYSVLMILNSGSLILFYRSFEHVYIGYGYKNCVPEIKPKEDAGDATDDTDASSKEETEGDTESELNVSAPIKEPFSGRKGEGRTITPRVMIFFGEGRGPCTRY